jgi:hypothetical protein
MLLAALLGLGALVGPAEARRPDPAELARLNTRLAAPTAGAVREIVEDAARHDLPTAPLVATALEGASRGVPSDRIVAAVRTQAASFQTAREALGSGAGESEIVAGASALRAGVAADSLVRLRAARGGSTVIPLVVMADMIARGVPPVAASGAMIASARAGVPDAELLRLREHIAQDIRSGASPTEAASLRLQILMTGGRGEPARPPAPVRTPGRSAP